MKQATVHNATKALTWIRHAQYEEIDGYMEGYPELITVNEMVVFLEDVHSKLTALHMLSVMPQLLTTVEGACDTEDHSWVKEDLVDKFNELHITAHHPRNYQQPEEDK